MTTNENQKGLEKGTIPLQTNTPSTTVRQGAMTNLERLQEAVERFGQEAKNGTIAPPTSAGRWK